MVSEQQGWRSSLFPPINPCWSSLTSSSCLVLLLFPSSHWCCSVLCSVHSIQIVAGEISLALTSRPPHMLVVRATSVLLMASEEDILLCPEAPKSLLIQQSCPRLAILDVLWTSLPTPCGSLPTCKARCCFVLFRLQISKLSGNLPPGLV